MKQKLNNLTRFLHKISYLGWKSFKGLCYYIYSGNIRKLTRANVKGYFQGLSRMYDSQYFNSEKPFTYLDEQFYYRITKMDGMCIKNGMCPCQCEVPAKQWEDRACEKNCYPPMLTDKEWTNFCLDQKQKGNLTKIMPIAIKRLYADHN